MVQLVPVDQWVYDLYKVTYLSGDPDLPGGGCRQVGSTSIAAASESHMISEAWENAPHSAEFITWAVVKENVGHPRVIGSLYGHSIHESGWAHGQRLAQYVTKVDQSGS